MSAACVDLCLGHSKVSLISTVSFCGADPGSELQILQAERSFGLDISREVVSDWEG